MPKGEGGIISWIRTYGITCKGDISDYLANALYISQLTWLFNVQHNWKKVFFVKWF